MRLEKIVEKSLFSNENLSEIRVLIISSVNLQSGTQ